MSDSGSEVQDWESSYTSPPAWDIGRPQAAFKRLAESGELRGPLLDVGCGTGEHALMAAELGLEVTGVDVASTAIRLAREKAEVRGIDVQFLVFDALVLASRGGLYETVIDCGLFHVFDDGDRSRFVDALRAVVVPGGRYHMLCFSDRQPGDWGPRRVTQQELRVSFADGWRVESIEPSVLDINISPDGAQAWMSTFTRL